MTSADLERFRRLAGMLGSEHVGERAAAALKCSEMLRAAGLTWSSVSLPVEQPDVLAQRRRTMSADLREMVERTQRESEAMYHEYVKEVDAKHKAAKKAAWRERSYGADADGFEPGRK